MKNDKKTTLGDLPDGHPLVKEQQEQIKNWIAELKEDLGDTPKELREYVKSQVKGNK